MLAGSLAGITEHAVIFPVDSIKVRFCLPLSLSSSYRYAERSPADFCALASSTVI